MTLFCACFETACSDFIDDLYRFFKPGIFICQKRYAREVLARFKMDESNAVKNPIVPGTKLKKDENG